MSPRPIIEDPIVTSEFTESHARWHAAVEARRTSPHGPLSVTSLAWLAPQLQRFPDIPGQWRDLGDGLAELILDEDESLERDGRSESGVVRVGPLTGIQSVTWHTGDRAIELAARSGSLALRVRDPRSPDRTGYAGTAVFPPDDAWVIDAHFIPTVRADVEVDSAIAGKTQHYDSPGVAEFEIEGIPVRLVLFGGSAPDRLRAIFADTSERTFSLARSVEVVRTSTERVRIDFNRATNPPCAYSSGATCPLPPAENRLPVAVEAGELAPGASPGAVADTFSV